MAVIQPAQDLAPQFIHISDEFRYIFFGDTPDIIILRHISFTAAGVQIFGILLMFFPKIMGKD